MSKDMPMYRHDDETTPAPLMIPPDCNDLILPDSQLHWLPIVPTADDLEFMHTMEAAHKAMMDALGIPPPLIGETYKR